MAVPETLKMSYIEALIHQTLDYHANILLARAYHEGIQPVYLTERQMDYLDMHTDNQFCLNVCRLVVTALRDELNIVGFDTGETPDDKGIKKQAQWFEDVWNKNRMDARQAEVHEWALRDSEAFIILDWDKENKHPVMVLHERFTDVQANAWSGRWTDLSPTTTGWLEGTGAGVWMIYENDDPNQKPIAAVQQWTEIDYKDEGGILDLRSLFSQRNAGTPGFKSTLRRTVYYPDRIERYKFDGVKWVQFQEVQPWLGKDKKPLGIPVIHFKNSNLTPEAWDAIPMQDGVNKTYVDILGTMDLSGYPLFVLLGMYPTTDGKAPAEDGTNVWAVGPAQMLGNANVKASDASIQKFEGTDPTPLMESLKDQIMFIAQITSTPANRFITTAQVASSETLKTQEQALRKRAYNRMILFGDAWKDVMVMARRIANAFGSAELKEDVSVDAIWKNIESLDDLKTEKELGIPEETIWAAMGKTQDQIKAIKKTPEYKLKFSTAFWTAYNLASQSGASVGSFAKSIGLSDQEIKELTAGLNADTVPPTDL